MILSKLKNSLPSSSSSDNGGIKTNPEVISSASSQNSQNNINNDNNTDASRKTQQTNSILVDHQETAPLLEEGNTTPNKPHNCINEMSNNGNISKTTTPEMFSEPKDINNKEKEKNDDNSKASSSPSSSSSSNQNPSIDNPSSSNPHSQPNTNTGQIVGTDIMNTSSESNKQSSSESSPSETNGICQNTPIASTPPNNSPASINDNTTSNAEQGDNSQPNLLDESGTNPNTSKDTEDPYSIRLTPYIDHSSPNPAPHIPTVERSAKEGMTIKVGRITDKNEDTKLKPEHAPVVFKSKVVSRTHAQLLVKDGQWFVQDVKSSSGTFLNHVRLSPQYQQSQIFPLKDGDILQLGMDFRGGTEELYKCIKVRVEVNRSWQRRANTFNVNALSNLRNLSSLNPTDLQECAICLMPVAPCQALFISPCTHAWHYKCIRPLVIKSYPHFLCPNCRAMCDLEMEIETPDLARLQSSSNSDINQNPADSSSSVPGNGN